MRVKASQLDSAAGSDSRSCRRPSRRVGHPELGGVPWRVSRPAGQIRSLELRGGRHRGRHVAGAAAEVADEGVLRGRRPVDEERPGHLDGEAAHGSVELGHLRRVARLAVPGPKILAKGRLEAGQARREALRADGPPRVLGLLVDHQHK